MGKIVVLYESQTGSTEKMAALIAKGCELVPGMEVRLRSVDDPRAASDVFWADGLAVGTPTNLGGISWRMKKFWDDWAADNWNKVDGKMACTFSSQGGHGGGAELACLAMNIVLMNFGFLVFGVTDYVDKLHTLHYGACVAKEPRNDYDIAACERLGLRLAEWIAVYVDGKKNLHPLLTTKKTDGREADSAAAETKVVEEKAVESAASKPKDAASTPAVPVPTAETHVGPVHLIVRASVPWRNQIAWKALVRELEDETRKEPGCVRYHFAQIENSETEFYVIEEYVSVAALETHSNSTYFKRLVPAMGKLSSTLSVEKVFPLHPQPVSTSVCWTGVAAGMAAGLGLAYLTQRFLQQN